MPLAGHLASIHRWAGPDKDFNHAMKRVADALLLAGTTDRTAEFVCALTLARWS